MHTEYLHLRTAVAFATSASDATATVQIGNDTALVANRIIQFAIGRAYIQHFHRQLVPHDAWIAEEVLIAAKSVQVCAADADVFDPHQRFARSGRHEHLDVLQSKLTGLFQYDGFQCIRSFFAHVSLREVDKTGWHCHP